MRESPCTTVAGRIDGIKVSGAAQTMVERGQMSVSRGGDISGARNGMPLCYGDVLATGSDVASNIRLDEAPESEKLISLDPNTTITLVDGTSLFMRLGRLFLSLNGVFEVKTPMRTLGARGTEFQVELQGDRLDVIQLEGTLDVVPAGESAFGALRPAWPMLSPVSLRGSAPRWHVQPVLAAQVKQGTVQLDRLTRLTMTAGQAPRIVAAEPTLVTAVVEANCSTIAATRPVSTSQSFPKAFATADQRRRAYTDARVRAILNPGPEPLEQLGRVYADWGDAARSVRSYQKAGTSEVTSQRLAIDLNALGNSYRLRGDFAAAEATYRKALAVDASFAFPYNGLGDVYRERALVAIDQGSLLEAQELMLKARGLYEHSLDPTLWGKEGGRNRAIPLYNLGLVALQLGQLYGMERSPSATASAEARLADAEKHFQQALSESPDYTFAEVGLGRVYTARAALAAAPERRDVREENLQRARVQLTRLVEQQPSFAVAHQALGEFLEVSGEQAPATNEFLRATQLDPSYALAYFRAGRALERSDRRQLAPLYYQAYLHVESPAFRSGARASVATAGASKPVKGDEPRPNPVPPLDGGGKVTGGKPVKVPDVTGDDRDKAVRKLDEKKLRLGRVIPQPTCDDIGKVLGQSPHEGTKVPEGSSVDITIGSAEDGIRVPDVRGLTLRDAEQRLRSVGLVVKKVERQESERPPGIVVSQRPKDDKVIARGCPMELVVAIPVPQVTVPSLVGLTEQQVRSQLPSGVAGYLGDFRLGAIIYRASRQVAAGTVIGQDPPAGTQVPRRQGTSINLVIAGAGGHAGEPTGGGSDSVTVPGVTRRSVNDAVQILRGLGLRPEIAEGDTLNGKGVVYKQSPAAGTSVPKGSVVKLYLPTGLR